MDKTSTGKDTRLDIETAVRYMLRSIASGRLAFAGPDAPDARPPEGRGPAPMYAPQRHSFCEAILPLSGEVRILAEGRWHEPERATTLVFPPSAMHSERVARKDRGYRMLWLAAVPGGIGVHVTGYDRGKGYALHGPRLAFRAPDTEAGRRIPTMEAPGSEEERARAQAAFLEVVAHILENMDEASRDRRPYCEQATAQVRHYLDRHPERTTSLAELAAMVHYSPSHLNQLFRREYGVPVRQYQIAKRLELAQRLLTARPESVKQVAIDCGFDDPLYFSRLYRKRFGVCPSDAIQNG